MSVNNPINKMLSNIKTKLDYQKHNSNNNLSFDSFKDHWKHVLFIFNKTLIEDKDIVQVKFNLEQMINILLNELNNLVNISLRLMSTLNEASSTTNINESIELQDPSDVLNAYYGPIWEFLFRNNIFEVIFLWSLSYPEYLYDLKYEQLKYYENLLNHLHLNEQTNLLLFKQLHRPLFSLLNHCASHNSELIEAKMIEILNQLCVDICKNSNLLNIFFEHQQQEQEKLEQEEQMLLGRKNSDGSISTTPASNNRHAHKSTNGKDLNLNKNTSTPTLINSESRRTNATSKFFIFSLLIPYIHKEGSLGQQARDALLMIMQLSSRNVNLAKYIVECTDFCPILATGLSGLYSELPQKLTPEQNVYEIRYLYKEDIINISALNKFINSLEFCNNVIQVSHSLIANKLLQFVYYGFLVPVIAPALTQNSDNLEILSDSTIKETKYNVNCIEEIIAATTYLDLFLRTINEPTLLKIFLKFILFSKFDEKVTLLDTLINRINTNSKLCIVTLMLFYTMIDLNSEDVIYKLILSYLIPCKHLMENQSESINISHLFESGANTEALLLLSTDFSNFNGNNKIDNGSRKSNLSLNLNESSIIYKWLNLSFERNELNTIISYLDSIRFNFVDYLKDAKSGIVQTIKNCSKWSSSYELDTLKLMNELHSSKSNCTESIILKENESQLNQCAKRPSQELDYDPEEFLLNLDLFSNSFNEAPPKSNRSTSNLFSKENNLNFDESQSVDEYDDEDFDEEDDDDGISLKSNSSKTKTAQNKKAKKIAKQQTATDEIFESSILSNKVDSRPSQSKKAKSSVTEKSVKKKVLNQEEIIKREKKRERRQKRRDRAAANDFYILSFDNELTGTSSSESETDSSSKNENGPTNATDDEEEGDLTTTSISSSTTLNNDLNSLKVNNFQTILQSQSGEQCREKLVEYLFNNKEKTKLYFESNLNDFLGALDTFFQLNEANIKNEFKPNNDINILCDQIVNIYNDIFVMQKNSTNLFNGNLLDSEKINVETIERVDLKGRKNSLKLTLFPNYVNESKKSLGDDLNAANKSLINNSTESTSSAGVHKEVEIGPFMCAILNRLEHMLSNSLQVNFLITGLLARLAYYPQILLRSFLLNHNLVTQANIKSLFQAIGNVKFKIDHCSKTYEDFSLLYLKAKLFLVKRLIDSKLSDSIKSNNTLPNNQSSNVTPPTKKKSSKMDKFLSIFFKPLIEPNENKNIAELENQDEQEANYVKSTNFSVPTFTSNSHEQIYGLHENKPNNMFSNGLVTPQVELDLNEVKTKFSKPVESFQLKQFNNSSYDFIMIENEWEDFNTRNIAFSVVIYDEFIKELAAICQEHSVTTESL